MLLLKLMSSSKKIMMMLMRRQKLRFWTKLRLNKQLKKTVVQFVN